MLPLHLFPTLLKSCAGIRQKGTQAYVLLNDNSYELFIFQKRDTREKGFDNVLCKVYK